MFSFSPTSQQLFDLSAGLRGGELVHNVQGGLAQGVSHSCTDPTLDLERTSTRKKLQKAGH